MDAELVRKTLNNFNVTTTNAIMMKLTTIMYLHKIFKLAWNLGVTHRVQGGANKKYLKIS